MGYTTAAIWGVSLSFPLLGLLLVGLRFWMRRKLQKTNIGIDDWTILFASVLVIGMGANFIVGAHLGTMGMDGQPFIETRATTQTKIDYAMLVFEKPAYGAIKISVLLFYRRIFTLPNSRIVNNCLIALIAAWTLAFWFADLLNCGAHPEANWDPTVKAKTHCINLFELLLVFAVTDVLTDIAIMWMPYPQIKKLHVDVKERWAIAGIFLLGTIDLIVGIVRMAFVIANQTIPAVNTHFNPPESTAPTFWTVTEVGIGVIAANLPALAPLYKQRARLASSFSFLRERLLSSRSTGTSRNDVTAIFAPKDRYEASSDDEAKEKSRGDSVGTWDQFERIDNMSAEELEPRQNMSQNML